MAPTLSPTKRRAGCSPKFNGTPRTAGQPGRLREPKTTVSMWPGAVALMEVAQPFSKGKTGPRGTESKEEFASIAVAERVKRMQSAHGFVLPPGLSLEFPFTNPK